MDGRGVGQYELQALCAQLAHDFPFAARLHSLARQASADRAWQSIARFSKNCREHKPGKKGYPRFQKDNRSVEYKTSGWRLEPDGKRLTFTDAMGIGTVRLIGTRKQQIDTFPLAQIKRVRLLSRADGSSVQFAVQAERQIAHEATCKQVGIEVGLKAFYTESDGQTVANPRYRRQGRNQTQALASARLPHSQTVKEPQAGHETSRKRGSQGQSAASRLCHEGGKGAHPV
jgi:putative transposase